MPQADSLAALAAASPALIDALDETFPELCPDPNDSDRLVWIKAGERNVVRKLREWQRQGGVHSQKRVMG
jgi:hypothetical protein